jgi:uncharacterized membrane protein (DUF2068 family)
MPDRSPSIIRPISAIAGAILLLVGTWLHPMSADPNLPLAAFTEYAADRYWVASHLMQLLGVTLIVATLLLLSRRLADGPAAEWAALGMAGAIASLAMTAALQGVDGVALKVMVDHWAARSVSDNAALFEATLAVRQIEIGLASIASLLFGLTASIYGIALWRDRRYPRWIAVIAAAGGAPTAIAGIAMAYTGFSSLAMALSMPSGLLLIFWITALGIYGWQRTTI